uniref:Uncharacterized protein n=1 Tax=Lygus hesperus TaxID=30085 RepID=A0A0A9X3H4_LYGHE
MYHQNGMCISDANQPTASSHVPCAHHPTTLSPSDTFVAPPAAVRNPNASTANLPTVSDNHHTSASASQSTISIPYHRVNQQHCVKPLPSKTCVAVASPSSHHHHGAVQYCLPALHSHPQPTKSSPHCATHTLPREAFSTVNPSHRTLQHPGKSGRQGHQCYMGTLATRAVPTCSHCDALLNHCKHHQPPTFASFPVLDMATTHPHPPSSFDPPKYVCAPPTPTSATTAAVCQPVHPSHSDPSSVLLVNDMTHPSHGVVAAGHKSHPNVTIIHYW